MRIADMTTSELRAYNSAKSARYRRRKGVLARTDPTRPIVAFWTKVELGPQCWMWTGATIPAGYGHFNAGNGRYVYAHRFAFELVVGPIPEGHHLHHRCQTPLCVNPDHLEPVHPREHMPKHHRPERCPRGHAFTPENIYYRPDNGARQCRECIGLRTRRQSPRFDDDGNPILRTKACPRCQRVFEYRNSTKQFCSALCRTLTNQKAARERARVAA